MRPAQALGPRADSQRAGRTLAIAALLLAVALDSTLLHSLLTWTSFVPEQTLRAYYEPEADGVALLLDHQQGGYITDLEINGGNLEIPAGRTIAIPLANGSDIVVRTLATDLAPYIVLGSEKRANEGQEATRFADGSVLALRGGVLEAAPWNASRPWTADKEWLRDLRQGCGLAAAAEIAIRPQADGISVRAGSCSAVRRLRDDASKPRLLVVVAGPHAAVVSRSRPSWQHERKVAWFLAVLVPARVLLLAFAAGSGPSLLASVTLFLVGLFWRTAAILTWGITLPFVVAGAAARLLALLFPGSAAAAWIGAALVLTIEATAIVAAILFLDVGTFGHERITREGDDHCSMIGYSTVRGDSLRRGSNGVVERLDDACQECRNRTSRFSREAQTLHWVHRMLCSQSFPAPAGGEVIFLGGGNDDLFYRPSGAIQLFADFAGTVRYAVARPVGATSWESVFGQASERAVATLDDQAAEIDAIVGCASAGGRRFHFLHDFVIWDLDHGRAAVRQRTFERRRAAVLSAGGQFIDLLEEFRQSAGVAWLNDFIHPSAVGQQAIADLLCARLAQR